MRRPKKQSGASLDSLLDTMTNVVGILVILLTVTQLGVGDAVQRIADSDSVKPEALKEARSQLLKLQKQRVRVARRLKALQAEEDLDAEMESRKIAREIADEEANIAVLLEGQEKKKLEEAELRLLQKEAQRLLEEQKKEADELLATRTKHEEEKAKLKAQLERAASGAQPGDTVINLPNPRAAPEGTTPITIICREGRIMYVDEDIIREKAQRRAARIITRYKLNRDPAAGIDGNLLTEEFNKGPIEDRYFRVTMTVAGRIPKLVFNRLEEGGETTEKLTGSSSQLQQRIKRIHVREHYVRFLVWPDSFRTYLEARKICSKRNLMAGWQAQTTPDEYTIDLGGPLRVGPPPPPPPKPKPQPKPPGGEKPKPAPEPKPRPRPSPMDVID